MNTYALPEIFVETPHFEKGIMSISELNGGKAVLKQQFLDVTISVGFSRSKNENIEIAKKLYEHLLALIEEKDKPFFIEPIIPEPNESKEWVMA